jgi:hypothetical protein
LRYACIFSLPCRIGCEFFRTVSDLGFPPALVMGIFRLLSCCFSATVGLRCVEAP